MVKYSKEDMLKVISSNIINCQKMLPKFKAGTSQHSLLKNRIKALCICKDLMMDGDISDIYTIDEFNEALTPITSIINKCKKGQEKFNDDHLTYKRLDKIIQTMEYSIELIDCYKSK